MCIRNIALLGLLLMICPLQAAAFARCDSEYGDADQIRALLVDHAVYNAPVAHFDQASSIRIETGPAAGGLIPHADLDAEGRPVIYYPAAFPPLLCRVVLATFLVNEGDWKPFALAARDAAGCIDESQPFQSCLTGFGASLEQSYGESFAAGDPRRADLAYNIFTDAAAQIGIHEYAHHLLNHFQRIRDGEMARVDAEFEADFYTMQNAAQTGAVVSAMYYFFKGLADIEGHTTRLQTPDYESGACRATNVEDITGLFGILPIAMLDAVDGGRARLRDASPQLLVDLAAELAAEAPPVPGDNSCGRLQAQMMREAHGDLQRLTSLLVSHREMLFTSTSEAYEQLGLDSPDAIRLLDDLWTETRRSVHLRGLSALITSRVAQRIGYGGANDRIDTTLDLMLAEIGPEMMARDYGRLLKVKGLNILYDSPRISPDRRLAQARQVFGEAVAYSPRQTEAWVNLAFLELIDGHCDLAAELLETAIPTTTGADQRDQLAGLRESVLDAESNRRCPEMSASFRDSMGF